MSVLIKILQQGVVLVKTRNRLYDFLDNLHIPFGKHRKEIAINAYKIHIERYLHFGKHPILLSHSLSFLSYLSILYHILLTRA